MGKVVDYLEKYYKDTNLTVQKQYSVLLQKHGDWIFRMMSSVLWDALAVAWDVLLSVER